MSTPNKEEKKCECAEMSCKTPCSQNHTCKTFWCEKCQPEKYSSPLPEQEWENGFDDKFVNTISDAKEIKTFIRTLLASKEAALAEELQTIINRCRTEKGLGISLARFLSKLKHHE